jgi:hypothetical protein
LIPEPQPVPAPRRQEIDPQQLMMMTRMEQLEKANVAYQNEIQRLRQLYMQQEEPKQASQLEPVLDKNKLAQMSTESITERLQNIKDNEQSAERERQIYESELADREWYASPPDEQQDREQTTEDQDQEQEEEEGEPQKMSESLEEDHVDPEMEMEDLPPESEKESNTNTSA